MKVILNQTVAKLGKTGQVVTVADGYARNYLFPKGLAVLADKNQIRAMEKREERLAAQLAATKAEAEKLAEKLNDQWVKIEGKVGADRGKLFGAITSQDIADAVAKQLGATLEKKQIALHDPIKRLGKFPIVLDLHRDVDAQIMVHIFDPEAPEEEVAPAVTEDTTEQEPATV